MLHHSTIFILLFSSRIVTCVSLACVQTSPISFVARGKGTPKESRHTTCLLGGKSPSVKILLLLLLLFLLPRRHVVWRDSVGVESSRSGLKSECADIFHQSFLCCYAILTSPKEGKTAVNGYNPALF